MIVFWLVQGGGKRAVNVGGGKLWFESFGGWVSLLYNAMLSTHAQFLDKENNIGAAPLKAKQTQKPSGVQQGPVKQKRSFGVDISKNSQNDSNRGAGPLQPIKKDSSSKLTAQRSAFADITNRPAGQKTQEKSTKSVKTKEPTYRPYPNIDFDAPIDVAHFPEPELPYSDPYIEQIDFKALMQLPVFPRLEGGPSLLEDDSNFDFEVYNPTYGAFPVDQEESMIDDIGFLNFTDDILPLSIEDIQLESH